MDINLSGLQNNIAKYSQAAGSNNFGSLHYKYNLTKDTVSFTSKNRVAESADLAGFIGLPTIEEAAKEQIRTQNDLKIAKIEAKYLGIKHPETATIESIKQAVNTKKAGIIKDIFKDEIGLDLEENHIHPGLLEGTSVSDGNNLWRALSAHPNTILNNELILSIIRTNYTAKQLGKPFGETNQSDYMECCDDIYSQHGEGREGEKACEKLDQGFAETADKIARMIHGKFLGIKSDLPGWNEIHTGIDAMEGEITKVLRP